MRLGRASLIWVFGCLLLAISAPGAAAEGGFRVGLEPPAGTSAQQLQQALEVIRVRLDGLHFDAEAQIAGGRIEVTSANELDDQTVAAVVDLLTSPAELEFRSVVQRLTATDEAYATTPITCGPVPQLEKARPGCTEDDLRDQQVVFREEFSDTKYVLAPQALGGDAIASAEVVNGQGTGGLPGPLEVEYSLKKTATETFAQLTSGLVGKPDPTDELAIVVDRQVISAPHVRSPITQGKALIYLETQGAGFNQDEARALADELANGGLPIELTAVGLQSTTSPGSSGGGMIGWIVISVVVVLGALLVMRSRRRRRA